MSSEITELKPPAAEPSPEERTQGVLAKINAILAEENCIIVAVPLFTARGEFVKVEVEIRPAGPEVKSNG